MNFLDAQWIADIQMAEERGYARGKAALIQAAELWCRALTDSAAFHPDQEVTRGQVENANRLLEYLKK